MPLSKVATLEPLGLVLAPNKLGQYPDGAMLAAIGARFVSAGSCENAFAYDVLWTIDAGATVLRAEIIPTNGYTLVLLKLAAGWRYVWVDEAGAASPLETPVNAYAANVDFEIDGRIDWDITRDRVWVTSTTGVMVFDYIRPTTAAERAPRLAGMLSPAFVAAPTFGADAGAIDIGNQAHMVLLLNRHFPDCYEATGAPSAAVQVVAIAAKANIQISVSQRPGHPQILVGDTIEVYRTIQSKAANALTGSAFDPGTSTGGDYYLSSVYEVTNPGAMSWAEVTGDSNLGDALYSNNGAQGASAAKRPPPLARIIETYRGHTFYFDITEPAVRVCRVGGGLGELTDAYSQAHGVGTRPGPVYDSVDVDGDVTTIANADDLAIITSVNVDDLTRNNPDLDGARITLPATGFAFRHDYAGAGDFNIKASSGGNYQPPLPTLAQTPELVERPRRENGFAWTELGQPEAVTQFSVADCKRFYGAVATSVSMIIFTDKGLFTLAGTGGNSSAGFDWDLEHVNTRVLLRGPRACCRMGDQVFAATCNGAVQIDPSGQVTEISTSALGPVGAADYSQNDRTRVVAHEPSGDVFFVYDGTAYPFVYSTRWNKWSRVAVAPSDIEATASELAKGVLWATLSGNTLTARVESTVNRQMMIGRFQPQYLGDHNVLKRFTEIEFFFHGDAFGADITLLVNKLEGETRTLEEHDGLAAPTFVQAALPSYTQGETEEMSLAQCAIEVQRDAPAISNSLSFGFVTPAGTTRYEFYGASVTGNVYQVIRSSRTRG